MWTFYSNTTALAFRVDYTTGVYIPNFVTRILGTRFLHTLLEEQQCGFFCVPHESEQ